MAKAELRPPASPPATDDRAPLSDPTQKVLALLPASWIDEETWTHGAAVLAGLTDQDVAAGLQVLLALGVAERDNTASNPPAPVIRRAGDRSRTPNPPNT